MAWHPRNGHVACGSMENHANIHSPKDGKEPIFHKPGGMCMPKHLKNDTDVLIRKTVDKMADEHAKRKSCNSCFGKK